MVGGDGGVRGGHPLGERECGYHADERSLFEAARLAGVLASIILFCFSFIYSTNAGTTIPKLIML